MNTTLPAAVNETTNITTTQSPGEETGDLVNATLSTVAATNSSKTQNEENATSTDVGGVTGMPTDNNVTTTVIDTEVSVVDVTATVGKNLTSVPDPGPSTAGPLTTEADNLTLVNNASISTTESAGSVNSSLSGTATGAPHGGTVLLTTGANVTNIDAITTTTSTTTRTRTTTTTEELKVPTTSNPHVSA